MYPYSRAMNTTSPAARFILATRRDGKARRTIQRFDTYDAALVTGEHAAEADGQLLPNADGLDTPPAGYEYERGIFLNGNRMAVIFQHTDWTI